MPDPQTATPHLAAAQGAPDTGAPSPPSDASVATAPSPNPFPHACAAEDIPTFADLKKRNVGLKVIKQGIDTTVGGPVGDLTMNLLAAFAAFETQIRRERQLEGIAKAKAKGVYVGGKRRFDAQRIRDLRNSGMGPAAIARELGCTQMTVHRALKE